MSKAAKMADLLVHTQKDMRNTVAALSFQARAWRITAIIATDDPKRGKEMARWLLMQTVPFVNGEAVKKFIDENEKDAESAGYKSGVFDRRKTEAA